jgi:ATP-dependent DNA helicase RecG
LVIPAGAIPTRRPLSYNVCMSTTREKSPVEALNTPCQFLKGVGPQRAELLAKLGLHFARDLLFFFPRNYEDMSELRDIDQLEEDKECSVVGHVEDVDLRGTQPGKCIVGVLLRQGTKYLRGLWFNQPFIREKFQPGRRVMFSGTPKLQGVRWEMVHPRYAFLGDDEDVPAGRILPVYSLTEGINQTTMRRIVHGVVDTHVPFVDDVFPEEFLREHRLWPIRNAIAQVHQPQSHEGLQEARRRLIYQELLVLQLALSIRKWAASRGQAPQLEATPKIDSRIRRLFPFELTPAQNQAIAEITADLAKTAPMNRLLQGDVGSGKTVIAEYAMLLTVAYKHQAVLMAPTEILARQHARTLARDLVGARVRIGLLVGSLSAVQRRETLRAIETGDIDLLVGTHAITAGIRSGEVAFPKLGLVVIDEQHKFGVEQRRALKQTGSDPHYLVMTATPIPRTIAMTEFGDLDVSVLREPPPGRQKVHTYVAGEERRERWWGFFRKKLREGRQGYVIAPLVDDGDTSAAMLGAEQLYQRLVREELADFKLGLVHGRMSSPEKDEAMERFRRGQIKVLVATSVVEVGVDVPNATLMAIEAGERFGLAQLHQLRGRITRGSYPGYCCVFARPLTEESTRRLEAFSKIQDGFELAEIDFQLRGPGDLFGTRQHGLPPLRIADLQRDTELLDEARRDAQTMIATDPELTDAHFARLKKMVLSRYGEALALSDVG